MIEIENPDAIGNADEAPVVQLHGDVRENSRAFGLPVVSDDGYNHDPQCWWCDGAANNDTCRRSIHLRKSASR